MEVSDIDLLLCNMQTEENIKLDQYRPWNVLSFCGYNTFMSNASLNLKCQFHFTQVLHKISRLQHQTIYCSS